VEYLFVSSDALDSDVIVEEWALDSRGIPWDRFLLSQSATALTHLSHK